ncbi:MAG TPA: hypothetical protein VGE39_06500 [Prosthecobacter sp.]
MPSSEPKPAVVVAITTRVRPVATVVDEPVVVAVAESVPEAVPIAVSSPAWNRPRTFAPLPDRRDDPKPAKPASHAWRSIG